MLKEALISFADKLRYKYRFEIYCTFSTSDFYKAKFLSDRERKQEICNLIYKKQQ